MALAGGHRAGGGPHAIAAVDPTRGAGIASPGRFGLAGGGGPVTPSGAAAIGGPRVAGMGGGGGGGGVYR
jgi:hypothetical protein